MPRLRSSKEKQVHAGPAPAPLTSYITSKTTRAFPWFYFFFFAPILCLFLSLLVLIAHQSSRQTNHKSSYTTCCQHRHVLGAFARVVSYSRSYLLLPGHYLLLTLRLRLSNEGDTLLQLHLQLEKKRILQLNSPRMDRLGDEKDRHQGHPSEEGIMISRSSRRACPRHWQHIAV